MEKISLAVDILSNKKTMPLFMTFDGYLGALGAFMQEFNYGNWDVNILIHLSSETAKFNKLANLYQIDI